MKKALPILIVIANVVVYSLTSFLIGSYAYREDEYGVPRGTPVTGIEVLIKLLLVLALLIIINVTVSKQTSNRLIKNGVLLSGGLLLGLICGLGLWLSLK
jgi:uncharacterized membrane protein YjgN (DUF898 family)